jgi:hypothetical protein
MLSAGSRCGSSLRCHQAGSVRGMCPMVEWLDEHCGVDGWSITPAGTRELLNDALAVYVNTPACALAFVARWLVPGSDPPDFYELR